MPTAGSKAGGTCMGNPDVCQVPAPPGPPVPTPFPNTAMLADATKTSTKVLIENKESVVETSEIPTSKGDQAGSAGGVVSGTVGDKVLFRQGSTTVLFEGKGAVFHSAPTSHNGTNPNMPVGVFSVPSQSKVIVMP